MVGEIIGKDAIDWCAQYYRKLQMRHEECDIGNQCIAQPKNMSSNQLFG
jgi:hypothetical protein